MITGFFFQNHWFWEVTINNAQCELHGVHMLNGIDQHLHEWLIHESNPQMYHAYLY